MKRCNILLIRSSHLNFDLALKQLRSYFGAAAQLDILCRIADQQLFAADPRISQVYPYHAVGPLCSQGLRRETLAQLRQRNYLAVCALYNNVDGRGYGNIDRLVRRIPSPQKLALNQAGQISALTWGKSLQKSALELEGAGAALAFKALTWCYLRYVMFRLPR